MAMMPATCPDAILVPVLIIVATSERIPADRHSLPGAQMLTCLPPRLICWFGCVRL